MASKTVHGRLFSDDVTSACGKLLAKVNWSANWPDVTCGQCIKAHDQIFPPAIVIEDADVPSNPA